MPASKLLLVEGKNDKHIILALRGKHEVEKTFDIEDKEGIDNLLKSIPVTLKKSGFRTLGIILDADKDIASRWDAVCNRLKYAGYSDLPPAPEQNGSIIEVDQMPRVGIWIMPNNHLSGTVEHFVSHLIPDDDLLKPKVEAILHEIESEKLNKYTCSHHQKAFIHTWLAWQKTPGQPMGQAITAQALSHKQPVAQLFINWLNLLFNP